MLKMWWFGFLPHLHQTSISNISTIQQVLTRRDQLKQKQEKEQEKKDKDAKKKEKEGGSAGAKAKAKGKAKAKATAGGKAKAKAKSAATTKAEDADGKESEEDDDEESMATPKKRLFQSDSEPDQDSRKPPPTLDVSYIKTFEKTKFIDPKTGKERTLEDVFEQYLPETWRRKMRRVGGEEQKNESTASGSRDVAAPKRRARGKQSQVPKAKATPKKGKSPKITSPSIKKEIRRRRKKEEAVMQTAPEDMKDDVMQGIFLYRLGHDQKESEEDFKKNALQLNVSTESHTTFSFYWKTGGVGVLLKKPRTHITLFTMKKAEGFATNMSIAHRCALLLVS